MTKNDLQADVIKGEPSWRLRAEEVKVVCLWFQVLRDVFPQHTFLMNGLVQGVKVNRSAVYCQRSFQPLLLNLTLVEYYDIMASLSLYFSVRLGFPVISVGSSDWCSVRHLGQEVLPPHDSVLYLRPHPLHEDQPLVRLTLFLSNLPLGDKNMSEEVKNYVHLNFWLQLQTRAQHRKWHIAHTTLFIKHERNATNQKRRIQKYSKAK